MLQLYSEDSFWFSLDLYAKLFQEKHLLSGPITYHPSTRKLSHQSDLVAFKPLLVVLAAGCIFILENLAMLGTMLFTQNDPTVSELAARAISIMLIIFFLSVVILQIKFGDDLCFAFNAMFTLNRKFVCVSLCKFRI